MFFVKWKSIYQWSQVFRLISSVILTMMLRASYDVVGRLQWTFSSGQVAPSLPDTLRFKNVLTGFTQAKH